MVKQDIGESEKSNLNVRAATWVSGATQIALLHIASRVDELHMSTKYTSELGVNSTPLNICFHTPETTLSVDNGCNWWTS
jgi:hypothetical protein